MQERDVIDAEFVVIREAERPPALFASPDRLLWLRVYWYCRRPHKKLIDAFWVGAYAYTAWMTVIEVSKW